MEGIFYNTCPAAGCHQLCALKVHVEGGRIRKVESADYPGDPEARSVCLKGLAGPRLVYHPDRLKYPLKRIGERGEGRWQRISWDEALDTIAAKLLEVKKKYGSRSVKIMAASSSHVGILMGRLMAARFANAWGAGGVFEAKSHWLADMRVPAASLLTLGDSGQTHRPRDVVHSKMIIVWGGNPAETHFPNMRFILDAKDQGAKLVVIGPLFDATAAKADRWIAIRPATDAALAMAMIHVIIREGLYDREYVIRHTVAPFLVGEKDGRFLRQDGMHAVWDETVQGPRPCDADIVLPDATIYERDDLAVNGDYLQLLEKAIEPLHETRTALEVWYELAERVGLGEYFRHTPQDYMRMLLASGHPSLEGITFERLEAEKIVRGNLPSPPEIPFARGNFPTPSGRIEFYSESLVEFGEELPFHRETLENPRRSPLAGRYPLIFLSAKVRATMHSIMANVDWMQEVSEEPLLHINPVDAKKRAVADGDWVVAFNDRGKVKLKARLSEAVPPGTVNVPHGWWPERFAEGHYSDLLHRIDRGLAPFCVKECICGALRLGTSG